MFRGLSRGGAELWAVYLSQKRGALRKPAGINAPDADTHPPVPPVLTHGPAWPAPSLAWRHLRATAASYRAHRPKSDTEPLSCLKAGGSGRITAASAGLSPRVAAWLQHPG